MERISGIVTSNGGTVEKVDEWGRRRLAYPINYQNEGYYVPVPAERAEAQAVVERFREENRCLIHQQLRLSQPHHNHDCQCHVPSRTHDTDVLYRKCPHPLRRFHRQSHEHQPSLTDTII